VSGEEWRQNVNKNDGQTGRWCEKTYSVLLFRTVRDAAQLWRFRSVDMVLFCRGGAPGEKDVRAGAYRSKHSSWNNALRDIKSEEP
jgi:hypothetical protein